MVYIRSITSFIIVLSACALFVTGGFTEAVSAEPPSDPLREQVRALSARVEQLRVEQRALQRQRDQAQEALNAAETLLGKRSFTPQAVKSFGHSSKRARSPLPKKRSKARFLANASARPQKRNLGEIMRRGPVLVALWATWCRPCVSSKEKRHLGELREALASYGVPLLSIGVDEWSKVNKSRDRWFYPLWHLRDAHMNLVPEKIVREAGLGLPLFFLRLPDGSVPYFLAGTLSDESVREWVTVATREKLAYSPLDE